MVETALISHGREARTKSELTQLRKIGKIPAVVYGKELKSMPIYVDSRDVDLILDSETGKNTIINLALPNNRKVRTMIREVQKDPIRGEVRHIDFHQISMKEKIHTEVPMVFTGEPAGVGKGGIIQHGQRVVEITCLPTNIPDRIEIAVDNLAIGDHITIADLEVPEGVTILSDPDTVLLTVVSPRLELEPDTEAKEPELITREREELLEVPAGARGGAGGEAGVKAQDREEIEV